MLGEEDGSSGGGSRGPCQLSGGRKAFWRSASWSSSRSTLPPLNPDSCKEGVDPNGNSGSQGQRFPAPLTPRSQQNCKARSFLPPLQPLAIARRSLDEWPKAGSDDVGEWPLPSTPSGRDMNKNGERLKLDLSSIQWNSDKNGGLVKREKIAFFDKECSKVADHVYLGGDAVAKDRDILKQNGITHILNCVGFVCPEYFKADFVYRTLWLQDSPSEDITSILYDVFDYFEDVREQAGRVFVHCCQGVSRSTSLVIAYLMWRKGQSFDDAFRYVKAARGIADPNMGFACQLLQCQKRVHAFPLSPSSLLRMYRIAPHSSYDPLHLVPKMLNDPSPSALDSRGAFIIHIPSSIYVWVGKKCGSIMERDARGAVCQIVRYERAQGPIVMIKEGEEPAYFWDAFSSLLPLMDKSRDEVDVVESTSKICPGERKVDSYNVDFEVFEKAIMGGFVPPFPSSETEHETCLPARESCWSLVRRKFASGNMKEFVSASKLALSRVYPDTNSASSSPPSISSSSPSTSSSSPPYLSPDSISSDSSMSSKYFSDSPAMSPSKASCSQPICSTVSSLSNFSLSPSRLSPSISKSSEFIDVNFTRQPRSQSGSSPCRIFPLSIAERRGSLSKNLKLPMLTDDSRGRYIPTSNASSSEPHSKVNHFEPKGDGNSSQESEFQGFSSIVASADLHHEESDSDIVVNEASRNDSLGEKEPTLISDMVAGGSACCDPEQPVICRWPSLEKLVTFGARDLDSKAAYIIIAPRSGLCKTEGKIVYFWVGRSLSHDESKIGLHNKEEFDNLEARDWNQVGSEVLTLMGLPDNTNIKILKEDEEPEEFLELLNSLQHLCS